jgi:glycosyltransferase involved in cell wall biosynthesis
VLKIVSNLRLPSSWACSGLCGESSYAETFPEFARRIAGANLIIVNGLAETLKLCELFSCAPWLLRPLVAVDVVLRAPDSFKSWPSAAITRRLLRKVDYFIHYFRDLRGYEKYFGILRERSGYVPFKPNLRYRVQIEPNPNGEYVLCIGHSMRDYETFFAAIQSLGYPAAITAPDFHELRKHRSRFTRSLTELPNNVRVLPDDNSQESLVRILGKAKLVVLPILKSSICASGIGIYLNSMLMGKCVLVSRGPGASDVLTNQAICFEPEDADDLALNIRCAWEDQSLRIKTAEVGHAYALSLGGEPELCERVLKTTMHWFTQQKCSRDLLFCSDLNSSPQLTLPADLRR